MNFWTYSCINVLRTLPYLKRWHEEYAPAGLQLVGIHTPEFAFEHLRPNVEHAVRELGIRYPVGQDNGYRTWRAWGNRAWPSFYLLDRDARIVMVREGEGHAVEMERTIRGLLGLSPEVAPRQPPDDADLSRIGSPELYFGALAPDAAGSRPVASPGRGDLCLQRSRPQAEPLRTGRTLAAGGGGAGPALRPGPPADALLRGEAPLRRRGAGWRARCASDRVPARRASVRIGRPALYTIVDGDTYAEQMVELEAMSPGLALYSATFG